MIGNSNIHVLVAVGADGSEVVAEQMPTAGVAVSRAKALAEKYLGVVAWSQSLDFEIGDYCDPVVLTRIGTIPDWLDEIVDAGA